MTSADFESCVTANRARWITYCSNWMPHQDAEDVVSEAVLKAWRGLPEFKGDSELSTWMGRIIRNLMIDRKRNGAGRFEHVPMWDDESKALKWLPEDVTHKLLMRELLGLIEHPWITKRERESILSLYVGGYPNEGSLRCARHWGILKLRCIMDGGPLLKRASLAA